MERFVITITYNKTIDAADEAEAERIVADMAANSNLVGEYAPFSDSDCWTTVERVEP